jgi:hypothetical protein
LVNTEQDHDWNEHKVVGQYRTKSPLLISLDAMMKCNTVDIDIKQQPTTITGEFLVY